jgi:hypothetical protein
MGKAYLLSDLGFTFLFGERCREKASQVVDESTRTVRVAFTPQHEVFANKLPGDEGKELCKDCLLALYHRGEPKLACYLTSSVGPRPVPTSSKYSISSIALELP